MKMMKKPATKPEDQFIFSFYAEDKKGLVGELLIHFNRSNYDVKSMNVADGYQRLVMLTLEVDVPLPPFKV